jgi:hypothetical protein
MCGIDERENCEGNYSIRFTMYIMGFVYIIMIVWAWVLCAIAASRLVKPPVNIHEDGFGFWMLIFAWPIVLIFDRVERWMKKETP